jgi:hypothetical protein
MVSILAVIAVVMAMMVATVVPAFAEGRSPSYICTAGGEPEYASSKKEAKKIYEASGYTCEKAPSV